jgi:glutathione S-transferase
LGTSQGSFNQLSPIAKPSHYAQGPNPLKVLIVILELGIPYEIKEVGMADVKQEPFLSLNPNGRMPALEDPNTGAVLWESGAIIEYLVQTYDKDHKISYESAAEKNAENSWKHFQMSGQGPYFGQYVWFSRVSLALSFSLD